MKFIMFPGGIIFFSASLSHDMVHLYNTLDESETPVAAGDCHLICSVASLSSIILDGESNSLHLHSDSAYPDWRDRYVRSGLVPQSVDYGILHGKIYYFPFAEIHLLKIGRFKQKAKIDYCDSSPAELVERLESE